MNEEWFNKNKLRIVMKVPVLWEGWECDSVWYVCEREGGEKVFVITDHGDYKIDLGAESLREKINEYLETIDLSERALKIINGES